MPKETILSISWPEQQAMALVTSHKNKNKNNRMLGDASDKASMLKRFPQAYLHLCYLKYSHSMGSISWELLEVQSLQDPTKTCQMPGDSYTYWCLKCAGLSHLHHITTRMQTIWKVKSNERQHHRQSVKMTLLIDTFVITHRHCPDGVIINWEG